MRFWEWLILIAMAIGIIATLAFVFGAGVLVGLSFKGA